MTEKNNNQKVTIALLNQRVGSLEATYGDIDKKLEKIMTNEIPHLHEDMMKVKTRMDVLTAVNLGAIILALIVNKFL